MKQIFLIFGCVLMLLTLHTHLTQAEIIEVLENWMDWDQDASTALSADGSTYAYVYHAPGGIYNAEYWAVSGSSSAYTSANSMGDDKWYDAIAWCEGSGDENTSPTPGRDNINENQIQYDSEGRSYYGDSYTDGDAEIAYMSHPVGTHHNPWTGSRETRTLSLSVYCSYYKRDYSSPTDLTAEPEMSASISGNANNFLNPELGSASVSDPD